MKRIVRNLRSEIRIFAKQTRFFTPGVTRRTGIVVFIIGVVFLFSLETYLKPNAIGGVYFQAWSSEDMMQTVSIVDLRQAPCQSLYYLHIQPPALDALRAVFGKFVAAGERSNPIDKR